jgi:hypothetical protein
MDLTIKANSRITTLRGKDNTDGQTAENTKVTGVKTRWMVAVCLLGPTTADTKDSTLKIKNKG